jgi:hypothetical protein
MPVATQSTVGGRPCLVVKLADNLRTAALMASYYLRLRSLRRGASKVAWRQGWVRHEMGSPPHLPHEWRSCPSRVQARYMTTPSWTGRTRRETQSSAMLAVHVN